MKRMFQLFILLGILSSGCMVRKVYVTRKPPERKTEIKMAKPHKNVVWVNGHWKWNSRKQQYVWVKGYWQRTRPNKQWISGRWQKTPKGWVWIKGYWK